MEKVKYYLVEYYCNVKPKNKLQEALQGYLKMFHRQVICEGDIEILIDGLDKGVANIVSSFPKCTTEILSKYNEKDCDFHLSIANIQITLVGFIADEKAFLSLLKSFDRN